MHWTLVMGLLGALASGVAGEAPKLTHTRLPEDDRLICSLIVLIADQSVDAGIGGTSSPDVDLRMARTSGCRPTDVRPMSAGEPSDRPTR